MKTQQLTAELETWWQAFRAAARVKADERDAPPTVLAEFLYVAGDGDPFGDDKSILELDAVQAARTLFDSWAQHDWPRYEGASAVWTWLDEEGAPGGEVDFLEETARGIWVVTDARGDRFEWNLDGITWRRVDVHSSRDVDCTVRYVERVAAWPSVGSTAVVVFEGARGPHWTHESARVVSIRRVGAHG